MKIVKFCLLPVLVLLVAVFGFGLAAPAGWDVEVSTEINATPAEIHAYVNDLKRWEEWIDFAGDGDSGFVFSFEGADQGVGAIAFSRGPSSNMRWEITASDPAKGVWLDELLEGSIDAKGAIMYEAKGDVTIVTWVDAGSLGTMPFIKIFHYMMQSALTDGFQRNLDSLKREVERDKN